MDAQELNLLVTLKQILLQTPHARENSAKTHTIIRCPICGDSQKDTSDAHCYVNIEGGKPITYYCFKCSEGHYVNSEFLRALNITDPNIISAVWQYNKQFLGKKEFKSTSKFLVHASKQNIVPVYDHAVYEYKLRYIEQRLGVTISYQELPDYKIILSLFDFVRANALAPTMKQSMMEMIERNHVGFLSADCSYIIFRNVMNNDEFRYINYPIFKNSSSWGSKSYILPNDLDIMANDIEFNVTEGIFDILGCYFNIKNCERKNMLYGAVAGAGFLGFVSKILSLGFIDNLNINIYSDNDKEISWYDSLVRLKPYYKSLAIWYNRKKGEKDIGVTKDRIDVHKVKLPNKF